MSDSKPIALITGASRGLGAALALALAPTHHIVAVGRTVGALEELDDRIRAAGGEATLAPMDITNDAAMQQLCRSIYDRWGKIDLWAHTAAHAVALAPTSTLAEKDWDKSLAINTRSVGRLIGYIAPLLQAKGKALFFDDPQGGQPYQGHYGATKAAQIALAQSWQAETVKTGPTVHILTPRPMATALRARFHPGEDRSVLADPMAEAQRLLGEVGRIDG